MPKLILAKVLKKKGLSKRQFAKRLEMDYRHVFRLFHADANPRFKTLCSWAKALGCKVRDLIEES